jgi:hypothetical protein
MAERPEGSFRPTGGQPGRQGPPNEAWPAPGDTQRIPPPVDEAGRPAVVRPVAPGQAAAGPYPPLPALPSLTPLPAPPGFGFRPQTEPSAILAVVLAVLAWLACPILAAIAALLIAGGAKAKIDMSGGAFTGLGLVTAARWIAWIHLFLVPLGTIALIIRVNVFGTLLS